VWGLLSKRLSQERKIGSAPAPKCNLPFILTIDASKLAVGAVLSHVEDGVEQPIAYDSRLMNTAERNYSAPESEILALVWAAKYYSCYGTQFVARSDHAAMAYISPTITVAF